MQKSNSDAKSTSFIDLLHQVLSLVTLKNIIFFPNDFFLVTSFVNMQDLRGKNVSVLVL